MSITANTEEAKKKSSKSTDRKLRDRSKMKPVDYAADDTAVEEEEVENYKDAVRCINTLSNTIILFNSHQHCTISLNSIPLLG